MDSEADIASSPVLKNLLKVCRLCLSEKYLKDVFEQEELSQWISEYLSIEVSASDEVSKLICVICSSRLTEFREFRQSCLEVQDIIQKELSKTRNNQCEVCQSAFETQKKLSDHMRQVHGPKNFACSVCDKSFIKPSRLKAHMVWHTAGEQNIHKRQPEHQFACTICSAIFRSKDSLKRHRRLHKQNSPTKVTRLRAKLRRKSGSDKVSPRVKNEHQTISEEPREATIIKQELLDEQNIPVEPVEVVETSDELNKLDDSIVCGQCGKVFDIRRKLWDHRRMVHGPRRQKCHYCDKAFVTRRDLGKHMAVHQRKLGIQFGCKICFAVFRSQESLESHSKLHKQNNQTKFTRMRGEPRTFERPRRESAREATSMTERDVSSPEAEGMEINTEANHELNHLPENSNNNVFAANAESEEISLSAPIEHQTISDEHSVFVITNIKEELLDDQSIRLEPAKVVDQLKNGPFECGQCGKVFDLKRKLWNHRRMVHGPRRQKCQYCDKAFVSRRDLEKHMGAHERPLGHQFGCTICSAVFQSQESLKEHSSLHKQYYQEKLAGLREHRTYGRARREPAQKADVSSSEAERMEIYDEFTCELDNLPENLDGSPLEANEEIEYLQPMMLSTDDNVISEEDERQSPVDKPVQKVACTICHQLINPSLNTLRAHLKTHGIVIAEESPGGPGENIHVEDIKVEPLIVNDD